MANASSSDSGPRAIRTLRVVAFDQFHHQRGHLAGLLEAVDLGDVGMIERRQRLGLALESRQPLRVAGKRRRQRLQRDVAAQLGVARPMDLAHATGAKWRKDFVWTEPGTGREGHGYLWIAAVQLTTTFKGGTLPDCAVLALTRKRCPSFDTA